MKKIITVILVSVVLNSCMNNTSSKIKNGNFEMELNNTKWLEIAPEFSIQYDTGYSEDFKIIVPGDFYLTTNYSEDKIRYFSSLSGQEICQLLDNQLTRTNCILLLNELHLISNIDNRNTTYEDWNTSISWSQMAMWKKKFGCE